MEPLYYTLDRQYRVCLAQSGLYHVEENMPGGWSFRRAFLLDGTAFRVANDLAAHGSAVIGITA